MASTSDIKNGFCFDFNGETVKVIEFQHVKPARGAAFVRTKLKSLISGKTFENTFPSGHKLDEIPIERRRYQFLYQDEGGYNFMDQESFDQIAIQEKMLDYPEFLKEGFEVDVIYDAAKNIALTVEQSMNVILEVTYTEPGVKGDTATNAYKAATVETGAEVKVPLFINQGDVIKVDIATRTYLERVKK
jgi:elongation factor P